MIDRRARDPVAGGLMLAPPEKGTRIRVIDFPPEGERVLALDESGAQAAFASIGGAAASSFRRGARHPLMHRTQTVDYGIVLEGEITLILDRDETTVGAGDIVIQRGTNHAWANRSEDNCRVAFVLIDGQFNDGL